VNTDADNTQNRTTDEQALIDSIRWEVANPINRPEGGYYPEIDLSDIECEVTRTVTQSAVVNLTDVDDLTDPQDSVDSYDWEEHDENREDEVWRISGMVKQSDYSELMTRYTKLLDLVRTVIPLVDIEAVEIHERTQQGAREE